MIAPAGDDEFRSHWFAFPVSQFLCDQDPGGPLLSIELRPGGRPAVIEVSGGKVRTSQRAPAGPAWMPRAAAGSEPRTTLVLTCTVLPSKGCSDTSMRE
jgi:hypothetical protein